MAWHLHSVGPSSSAPEYAARVLPNLAHPSWADGFQWEGRIRLLSTSTGAFECVLFSWGQRNVSTGSPPLQWSVYLNRQVGDTADEWRLRVQTTSTGLGAGSLSGEVEGVPIAQDSWVWVRATYIGDDGSGDRSLTVDVSTDDTDDPDTVSWTTVDTDTNTGTAVPYSTNLSPTITAGQVAYSSSNLPFDAKVMRVHTDPLGSPVAVAYPRWTDQETSEFVDATGLRWGGWRLLGSTYGGIVDDDGPPAAVEDNCAFLQLGYGDPNPDEFTVDYNAYTPDDAVFDWVDGFELTTRFRIPFYGAGPGNPDLSNAGDTASLKLLSQVFDTSDWSFVLSLTGDGTTTHSLSLLGTTDGTLTGQFTRTVSLPLFEWDQWYWVRVVYLPSYSSQSRMFVQIATDATTDPDDVGWEHINTWSSAEATAVIDNGAGTLNIGSPMDFGETDKTWYTTHRFDVQYAKVITDPDALTVVAEPSFIDQPPAEPMGTFTDDVGQDWGQTGSAPLVACPVETFILPPIGSAAVAYGPLAIDPGNILYTPGGGWPPEWGPEPEDTIFPAIIDAVVVDYDNFEDEYPITGAYAHEWQEPMQEPGKGSVTFTYNDYDILSLLDRIDPDVANSPSILTKRLIMYRLYGQAAFTMRPEQVVQGFLTPQEEYTNEIKVSGTQHLALLDEAIVYPSLGPGSIPIEEDRPFNWTSPYPTYDHASWKYAKRLARWSDNTPGWFKGGVHNPESWPTQAQSVYWIGPSTGTSRNARAGTCYFRKEFTVPTGVEQIAFFFSTDNRGDLYLDGQLLASCESWHDTSMVFIDVTPGVHYLAAEVTNYPLSAGASTAPTPFYHTVVPGDTLWGLASRYYGAGSKWRVIYDANQAEIQSEATSRGIWNPLDPGHWIFPGQVFVIPGLGGRPAELINPIGLLVAGFKTSNGQLIAEDSVPFVQSDHTWRIVEYPPNPPGMTVGRVMRVVIAEARNRGALPGITLNFNDKVDSAGVPWPVVSDISTKVGNDYLTFFVKELTETYVDLWMHPGSKVLSAWNKGGRGQALDLEYSGPTDDDQSTSSIRDLMITRYL